MRNQHYKRQYQNLISLPQTNALMNNYKKHVTANNEVRAIKFDESKKRIRFIIYINQYNMEITINDFENSASSVLSGDQHLSVAMHTLNFPGDDEDEDEDESGEPNDENPPADEEVVHSPVPTQPGKPRRQL